MRPISGAAINTTCPYCGVGCGITVGAGENSAFSIDGDISHPANKGNLCLKGKTLGETLGLDNRLLYPEVYGERSSWDNATTQIADKFTRVIEEHGPDAVAFYVSGQLLTEDYYAVNKFVKGYLGTANIDTNSRLCMASSVAGHKRAFGSDTVPGCYEDLELANLVILTGANLAWCHPVLFNRLDAARQANPDMRVINIDPRRTASAELADESLQIKPDSDTALFAGLLRWLANHNYGDSRFVETATQGLEDALATAGPMDLHTVASHTGLTEDQIHQFYQQFATTKRVVTVYSQGVNQSVGGTDKVNAIINCHLYTGRIGKPGTGPFSITGQPNAMGGRETGGLANTLTCHMELGNTEHQHIVQEYWRSPAIADKPGLTAVDLFNAVHDGKVKALWIMATNPLVSLPDSRFVEEALRRCEFVVQSDVVTNNDTSAYAHIRLPAQAWGEKDGTVTNSERCISRQRRFIKPPGETQPDWFAIAKVAQKMGFKRAFDYHLPHEIFAEYARLSGLHNGGSRDFDISAFKKVNQIQYDTLEPFYWPATDQIHTNPIRFFANGRFFTDNKRARFIATEPLKLQSSNGLTLALNSGRTRDQWHTMTRTGLAHTLANHNAEPFVQLHPEDAAALQLNTADIARVSNANGYCDARVVLTDSIAKGAAFIPMHWCAPFAGNAKVNALTARVSDPVSKQPALKRAQVTVEKIDFAQYGFIVSSTPVNTEDFDYFATAACAGGWRYEFAARKPLDSATLLDRLFSGLGTECVEYRASQHRFTHYSFAGSRLVTALIVDSNPVTASRNWLASQLTEKHSKAKRHSLLAAVKPKDAEDKGEIVCTCMQVGSKQIIRAIEENGCRTLRDIGDITGASTNCGSCRSDVVAILKQETVASC